jgi:2-keto-4-pentenoate hydratase/2-oxohepta-3-ene-1,7-dioic acid hydratase in catechol pathway
MRIGRARIAGDLRSGEIENGMFHPVAGDVLAGTATRSGEPVELGRVRLESPIEPNRILITMGGFMPADGSPLPPGAAPWFFPKLAATTLGDHGEVIVPGYLTKKVWVEAELAIVIGRELRAATEDEAVDAIFGFTCFNDVSAPEYLFEDIRVPKLKPAFDIYRAKSIDTFSSMGPWIDTELSPSAIRDGLEITTRINGQVCGGGNTRNHKFSMAAWVQAASATATLYPGDVIALGTPRACEAEAGDAVEIEIEGLGVLHNQLVASAT